MIASLLAGFSIGIACILFVTAPNPIIGAVLFGIGLLNIRLMKYKLVTGNMQRIYTESDSPMYSLIGILLSLLMMFFVNGIGVLFVAFLGECITNVGYAASLIAMNKLATPLLEVFVRAIVCGYLMTIATRPSTPLWMTPLCVFAFVYTGMYHCVADIFYYSMLSGPSACLPHLGVTVAGNTLGAVGAAVTPQSPPC